MKKNASIVVISDIRIAVPRQQFNSVKSEIIKICTDHQSKLIGFKLKVGSSELLSLSVDDAIGEEE